MSQPAACACGQVLFDVGDKKPNDVLTCPWCDRKYRYLGNGKVEPADAKTAASEPSSSSPNPKAASRDSQKSEKKSKDEPKSETEKKPDAQAKKAEERKADVAAAADHLRKVDDKRPRLAGTAKQDPMTTEGRHSVRKARKGEIPGGVGVMVGFIVAFNALAFIALKFLLPAQLDGSRIPPWNTPIPKSAIWPEIVALLVGHFVGFIAWSTYLYFRQQKAGAGATTPPPQLPVENKN